MDRGARNIWPATILILMAGGLVGLGAYTFLYARGYSYLSNDSSACANCHVMKKQYAGWVKSSHRDVAGCNSCHTPPGWIRGYGSKAVNGFNHSWAMTTGRFEEPIRINDWNRSITQQACIRCHKDNLHNPDAAENCARCHGAVGHP